MSVWIKRRLYQPLCLVPVAISLYFLVFAPSLYSFLPFLYFSYLLVKKKASPAKKGSLVCLGLLALFFLGIQVKAFYMKQQAPRKIDQIRLIPDTIQVKGNRLSFRGHANGRIYQAFYKLKSEKEQLFFKQLDQDLVLQVEGSLEEPDAAKNFSGFDYKFYLHSQGIEEILKIDRISALSRKKSFSPRLFLSRMRRWAILWAQSHFPAPMKDYMTGLLFAYLGQDFDQMGQIYSKLGIIHLFALSGMQVSFFLNLFRTSLLRLGLRRHFLLPAQVLFSIFYAGITGFSVSVLRSLVQSILSLLGFRGQDNIGLTLLLLFFLQPHYLTTAGGLLSCSFAFVLSILKTEGLPSWKKQLLESLALSLGVLPILLFYFSEFQPWSLLYTFFFSFLFDYLILPLVLILFVTSFLLPLTIFNPVFTYLESLLSYLGQATSHPLVLGQPQLPQLLALLFCLALFYDAWPNRKKIASSVLVLTLLFVTVKFPLENEVTLLASQGPPSLFFRSLSGPTLLVNLPSPQVFPLKEAWQDSQQKRELEKTLLPYLKSRGLSDLDTLLLTDDNLDQRDLLLFLDQIRVKKVLLSQQMRQRKDLLQVLDKQRITPQFLSQEVLNLGFLSLENQDKKISFHFMGQNIYYQKEKGEIGPVRDGVLVSWSKIYEGKQAPLVWLLSDEKSQVQSSKRIFQTHESGSLSFRGWSQLKLKTVR